MIKHVSESEFIDTLVGDEYANFSYDGARALFEYLERDEEYIGEQIEFDSVALRCQFTEYDSLDEILKQYSELDISTLEELRDHTVVIDRKSVV